MDFEKSQLIFVEYFVPQDLTSLIPESQLHKYDFLYP